MTPSAFVGVFLPRILRQQPINLLYNIVKIIGKLLTHDLLVDKHQQRLDGINLKIGMLFWDEV
ncbi:MULTISPECIES: hypothetical protein [Arcicella]|uniref:Uncharacterized protein n=1 Tax=Arcicella aquatica TaxID=217141 RepID=A0ABU5QPA5_9BACT|nr:MULTISPECIES: hypothetical protein [Arcicella]MDR6562853.1 putative membrane protein [Arcicella sp. BE51]MDR6812806.1 putative membrane protein [Arcicella sp. BE140]MDR6824118.1 putative membrane protein [Arcicella sp. BE139]MEA5258902.1 hypothetical protein [Arcicella aquatica]